MRKIQFLHFTLITCLLCAGCSPSENILPASSLHPFGRVMVTGSGYIELISSAAHFGFTFQGKECQVSAYISDPQGHNYVQYELDGVYQKRVKIGGKDKQPIIINAKSNGTHTLWLYKATEAHSGPI